MKPYVTAVVGIALALSAGPGAVCRPAANHLFAVNDASRPPADTGRDRLHKAVEVLDYLDVKPGTTVVDLFPGGGYWSRLFARAVGAKGRVYAVRPSESRPPVTSTGPIAPDASYGNVTVLDADLRTLRLGQRADLVWVSKNYRDLYREGRDAARAAVRGIYTNVKPGGHFVVLDHVAAPDMALERQLELHRIDPAIVRADVTRAGFVYVGQSKLFADPHDDHTRPPPARPTRSRPIR